jgi:hypothetical protein
LPASSITHAAVRLPPTSNPANMPIAALHSSFAKSPAKASHLPPESSNLMYGMYNLLIGKVSEIDKWAPLVRRPLT